MNDAMIGLERRVAGLEAANRRWRRLATCSAIALGGLALLAAKADDTLKADRIEARRLVIVDEQGRALIDLGMMDGKFAAVQVKSPGGKAKAMLYTGEDHPTLALSDQDGSSSITLNGGGAETPPSISVVRLIPGQIHRIFQVPDLNR